MNLFYFLLWIGELNWIYTDFPSDIHLICAYCRSAGRRFLSAAARACSRNHSWFQTSSFSDWMQLTRRPWIRKCLWSKNEWIWGCCWRYAQRIHIARWLNKMAECWIHVICCQPRVHPLTVQITRKLWIVRAKNACGNRIKGLNNCYRNF